jgi:hypothetical protein
MAGQKTVAKFVAGQILTAIRENEIVLNGITGHLTQVRRLGAVLGFFQKNTLDTNLLGAIWGILFA